MVLVTGAPGHVGSALVRELLARGERVRALALPGEDCSSLGGLDVEIVRGTVLDPACLPGLLAGVDVVYHLAGIISIQPGRDQLMREVNVIGTWNVARAAREAGVRMVHVASIHALGRPPRGVIIDERIPFDPHNAAGEYDRTKAEAALLVLSEVRRGLEAVIACPTGIVGPYDFRESETGRLIRSWLRPGPHAIVNGKYDFVDVRDVATGLVAMASRGRSGETYILSGSLVTVRQILDSVRRETRNRSAAVVVPKLLVIAFAPLLALANHLRGRSPQFTRYSLETLTSNADISNAKARSELGWEPRPFAETIRDSVAWWRGHPEIAPRPAAQRRRRPSTALPGRERVAVVTGASGGIGALTARRLAEAGYHVELVARRQDRLGEVATAIRAAGGSADTVEADLSLPEGPRAVFEHVMERHRGIDVLVNNAGIGWYGWTSDMPWMTAHEMLQVNNAALVQLIVLFLPVMRQVDRGHIINVSSVAGSLPSQGVALYCATKSFVDSLTTSLYRELRGTGVRVSAVKPGAVLTEFYRTAERRPGGGPIPAERFGIGPEAVAAAIMRLLARPRRTVWVPGRLRVVPWIEFGFGWLIDRLGPLLLRRKTSRA